jgi:hypothetical protein
MWSDSWRIIPPSDSDYPPAGWPSYVPQRESSQEALVHVKDLSASRIHLRPQIREVMTANSPAMYELRVTDVSTTLASPARDAVLEFEEQFWDWVSKCMAIQHSSGMTSSNYSCIIMSKSVISVNCVENDPLCSCFRNQSYQYHCAAIQSLAFGCIHWKHCLK